MPRQAPLRDQDLADALNHLMALSPAKDAVKPFAAAEFARARQGKPRTPTQVAELRRALVTDGKVR
jgi:hypothetical protein